MVSLQDEKIAKWEKSQHVEIAYGKMGKLLNGKVHNGKLPNGKIKTSPKWENCQNGENAGWQKEKLPIDKMGTLPKWEN